LLSPRSEDRPIHLSHHRQQRVGDMTPPISPKSEHNVEQRDRSRPATPPRILSSPSRSPPSERQTSLEELEEDERRLEELNRQLAALPAENDGDEFEEEEEEVEEEIEKEEQEEYQLALAEHSIIDGLKSEVVHDREAWAKQWEHVENVK